MLFLFFFYICFLLFLVAVDGCLDLACCMYSIFDHICIYARNTSYEAHLVSYATEPRKIGTAPTYEAMTTDLGCAGLILIPPNDSPKPSASEPDGWEALGICSPPETSLGLTESIPT